jgi:hypothetical protein
MKQFFDDMLYSLFCFYRRKNDAFIASFHSKGMIAVAFMIYFFDIYLVLKISRVINFELSLPNSKLITGLILLVPCEILVYTITDSYKSLEKKYIEEGGEYIRGGWRLFNFFFAIRFILLVFLALINKA